MKVKKNAKLVLKKETISHLENFELTAIKGGEILSIETNCKYPLSLCWCRTVAPLCPES